ncbi:MAG: phosphate uptake regulator PhoU [Halobacteriales archaeon]|nr:phosphate uptake regulator PhoU [Halobacteriales archaeon]
METRKVQMSGGSTYTVSLPKTWAIEHGIEAGSVLFLHPQENGTLQLTTDQRSGAEKWKRTLSIGRLSPRQIQNRLIALYAVGFGEITLQSSSEIDDTVRRTVTEATAGFTGLEVMEADSHSITLQNLAGAENLDIRKSTLRLRLVTTSMYRDAVSALLEDDSELAKSAIERDAEADKLFALLTRHFRRAISSLEEVRQLGHNRQDIFEYYYVGRQLERVADHAERIASLTVDVAATVPDEFHEEIESLAAHAQQSIDKASKILLMSSDVEAGDRVLEECDALLDEIATLDRTLYDHDEAAEAHLVGRLLDSLRRTVEYSQNVARIVIQQSVRQVSDK